MMNKFVNEDGIVNEKVKSKFFFFLNEVQVIFVGVCIGNKEFFGEKGELEKFSELEIFELGKFIFEFIDLGKKEY